MIEYYVVSKSRMVRIHCDGPLTAQVEKAKLEESLKAAGYPLDVEIELQTKPRPGELNQRPERAGSTIPRVRPKLDRAAH
jgi:hypothetical protein